MTNTTFLPMQDSILLATTDNIALFLVGVTDYPISVAIHFEGSSDGGNTWKPLLVRPIYGGIPQEYILQPGAYYTDIQHTTHIRYLTDVSISNSFQVQVKFISTITLQIDTKLPTKRYTPNPSRLNPILRSTGGREITDATPDGIVYARGGLYLYRSNDLGITWDFIPNPFTDGVISRFLKLPNNELLVAGNNLDNQGGLQIWKSDRNEQNFRKITTLDSISDANSFWGLNIYDNIILYAPYVIQPRTADQPLHAYLSRDYGETWQSIFQAPAIDLWHFHTIKLDTYEDRIWLLSGDGAENTNIWFSDNWGYSWNSVWDTGQGPVQFTEVAILPDCVIFGMDDNKGRGWFRLDKTPNRLMPGIINSQLHGSYYIDIGTVAQASGRYITKNNIAYLPCQLPGGILVATPNGFDYFILWDYTKNPTGTVQGLSFFYVTNTGKLIGYFKDESQVESSFIWIADEPTWIEI